MGDKTTTFSYDANNIRFKRTDSEGTIYYVASLGLTIKAKLNDDGSTETYIKRYLGEAMQTYYVNGNSMLRWLFKDNQGSVIAITNDNGKLVKRFKYDVFGAQPHPQKNHRIVVHAICRRLCSGFYTKLLLLSNTHVSTTNQYDTGTFMALFSHDTRHINWHDAQLCVLTLVGIFSRQALSH